MRGFEVKASQARNDDQRGRLEVGCPGSVRLLPSAFHGPEVLGLAQEVHLRPESRGFQARGMSHNFLSLEILACRRNDDLIFGQAFVSFLTSFCVESLPYSNVAKDR